MRLRVLSTLLVILSSLSAALGQTTLVAAGTLPVVGSVHGNFGSNFKTTVQLANADAAHAEMKELLVFHPAGSPARPTDPSLAWTLPIQQTLVYDDVVAALGQSGLGTLDVFYFRDGPSTEYCSQKPYSGGPVVVARIYNDAGDAGTLG